MGDQRRRHAVGLDLAEQQWPERPHRRLRRRRRPRRRGQDRDGAGAVTAHRLEEAERARIRDAEAAREALALDALGQQVLEEDAVDLVASA